MWTRSELKEKAKTIVHGNYWTIVGILVLFSVIESVFTAFSAIPIVGSVLAVAVSIFATLPITVSEVRFALNNRNGSGSINDITYAFKNSYMNQVCVMFMMSLFVCLWTLLLVIPGIIKQYEYRMVPYIIAENPEMGYKDALAKSKQMMDGQKMNAFLLDLSFIGWWLLSGITFGIVAIFWVIPYTTQTNAELYAALSANDVVDSNATV